MSNLENLVPSSLQLYNVIENPYTNEYYSKVPDKHLGPSKRTEWTFEKPINILVQRKLMGGKKYLLNFKSTVFFCKNEL